MEDISVSYDIRFKKIIIRKRGKKRVNRCTYKYINNLNGKMGTKITVTYVKLFSLL